MYPKSYIPARLRCTLPVDKETQTMGIAFNLEDGEIIRLRLDLESAKHLSQGITEFLEYEIYKRKYC